MVVERQGVPPTLAPGTQTPSSRWLDLKEKFRLTPDDGDAAVEISLMLERERPEEFINGHMSHEELLLHRSILDGPVTAYFSGTLGVDQVALRAGRALAELKMLAGGKDPATQDRAAQLVLRLMNSIYAAVEKSEQAGFSGTSGVAAVGRAHYNGDKFREQFQWGLGISNKISGLSEAFQRRINDLATPPAVPAPKTTPRPSLLDRVRQQVQEKLHITPIPGATTGYRAQPPIPVKFPPVQTGRVPTTVPPRGSGQRGRKLAAVRPPLAPPKPHAAAETTSQPGATDLSRPVVNPARSEAINTIDTYVPDVQSMATNGGPNFNLAIAPPASPPSTSPSWRGEDPVTAPESGWGTIDPTTGETSAIQVDTSEDLILPAKAIDNPEEDRSSELRRIATSIKDNSEGHTEEIFQLDGTLNITRLVDLVIESLATSPLTKDTLTNARELAKQLEQLQQMDPRYGSSSADLVMAINIARKNSLRYNE